MTSPFIQGRAFSINDLLYGSLPCRFENIHRATHIDIRRLHGIMLTIGNSILGRQVKHRIRPLEDGIDRFIPHIKTMKIDTARYVFL